MNHDEKVRYLVDDLGKRGVGAYTVAPPVYRLLWRLGIDVVPPHFAAFWPLAVSMGVFFAVIWGLVMSLFDWKATEPHPGTLFVSALIAGLIFGLLMARFYQSRARRLSLPRWEDYPAAH